MERTLDFEANKVELLTLDELKETYHEHYPDGTPVGGIYHDEFYSFILESLTDLGFTPVVKEIFAANNKDKYRPGVTRLPFAEEQFGEKNLKTYILRRVFANIEIMAVDGEFCMNMAVAYHQKGLQVAVGPFVHVCHNQSILSAKHSWANYSTGIGGKVRFADMNQALRNLKLTMDDWRTNYLSSEGLEKMKNMITFMKETPFYEDSLVNVLGTMLCKRVRHDSANKMIHDPKPYPLNASDLNAVAEKLLVTKGLSEQMSFWDIYNIFNSVIKPSQTDIPSIMPQLVSLNEVLLEELSARTSRTFDL